jgi:hypothetical protein
MKIQNYNPLEDLQRIKLMMGYDSRKTLSENKDNILKESQSSEGTVGATIIGAVCGTAAGIASWGLAAVPAAVGCAAVYAHLQDLLVSSLRTDEPSKKFQGAVNMGSSLTSGIKGLKFEQTPGFDPKIVARTLYDAMYENFFGTGFGTDESAIRTAMDSINSLVDLYLVDKYFREKLKPGVRLSDALQYELETNEWSEILDKTESLLQQYSSQIEKAKSEKAKSETNNKFLCLSKLTGIKGSGNTRAVAPSEDGGGYCYFDRNPGTQTFDSGKIWCMTNDKKPQGAGEYSCSGGKLSIKKYKTYINENKLYSKDILCEMTIGGINLSKSFNTERVSDGGDSSSGGGSDRSKPVRIKVPIPPELKDATGVMKFQDWLDSNHAGWAYGSIYPTGKVERGKGYGRFGPRTQKAWKSHKNEYLSQGLSTKDPDLELDPEVNTDNGL